MTREDVPDQQDFGLVDAVIAGGAYGLATAILPMLLVASWIILTTPERLEVLGAAVVVGAAANALRRHTGHRGGR